MIKVAFGSVPKDGGTFTFFSNMRPLLLEQGIDLQCVSVGKAQAEITDPAFVTNGCIQLAASTPNLKKQAQAFDAWARDEKIDIVFGVNSPGILSSIPHLPTGMRVLARCANGFEEGYRLTLMGRERLMRIVALTPRLKTDLIADFSVPQDDIILIPNGADKIRFQPRSHAPEGPIKLAFLGRLEHNQKGVLHLPPILEKLDQLGLDYTLSIAGQGKDGPELRQILSAHEADGRVSFVGPLTPAEIPNFLSQSDIYLFPSHFEGCPNALLEAMMAGCVPVAWQLEGITDFLLKDGQTGLLAQTGNADEFAGKIVSLMKDVTKLAEMKKALALDARDRFSTEKCATTYVNFFHEIMSETPPDIAPIPWSAFKPDPLFRESLASRLLSSKSREKLKRMFRQTGSRLNVRRHV